jgi:DNA end-binding protein Ku
MAPRANWKGYLKLSLVSCAVALYPASSTSERVSFNTINRKTGQKVKRIYIDPDTGEEVGSADQVKGYAVAKNQYVLIEDDDLEGVKIESSHTIDIEKFVPRAEIDPRYMDVPYYITPEDKVAQEPFAVIREAMRDADVVGLGRVVVSRRERIVMLEPFERGLLGTLLRYGYEVRDAKVYFDPIPEVTLPDEMKDLAHVILSRKAGHFEPTEFKDRYEDALVALVQSKQAGTAMQPAGDGARASNVVDLMEALRRSIGGPTEKAPSAGKAKPAPSAAADVAPKPAAPSKAKTGKMAATSKPATAAKPSTAEKPSGSRSRKAS